MGGQKLLLILNHQKVITISRLTMRTTTDTGTNQKSVEERKRTVSNPLKPIVFLWKFNYNQLDIFFKPMGTIKNRIMWYAFVETIVRT